MRASGLISELVPHADDLVQLEPEEVGGLILEHMQSPGGREIAMMHRGNYFVPAMFEGYPRERRYAVAQALQEGWAWLERQGYLVGDTQQGGDWVVISRAGEKYSASVRSGTLAAAATLPRQLLHPAIDAEVWPAFLRGDYANAVLVAFRQVEESARAKCGFPATVLGTDLMRQAFAAGKGPLADTSLPVPEQEATAHLAAGAIGRFKNPHSHRTVRVTAAEAIDAIMLASLLRKLIG